MIFAWIACKTIYSAARAGQGIDAVTDSGVYVKRN